MKKIGITLAIAAAATGALLWWSSLEAHRAYRALVAEFDARPAVRVLETTYESGWLQSNAMTEVEVRGAGGRAWQSALEALGRSDVRPRVGFRITHEVEHGLLPLIGWIESGLEGSPVVVRVTSRVDLDQEARAELRRTTGPLPALLATTTMRASGVGESLVSIAAQPLAARAPADDEPVTQVHGSWKGLQGRVLFSIHDGTVVARFHSPGLELAADGFRFEAQDLSLVLDLKQDASGLRVGTAHPRLGRLTWSRLERVEEAVAGPELPSSTDLEGEPRLAPPPLVRLVARDVSVLLGLDVEISADVSQGSLLTRIDVAIDRFDRAGLKGGPGAAHLVARNVDARALAALRSQDEPSDLYTTLRRVAGRSPVLELTGLTLETDAGLATAQAHVRLAADRAIRLVSPATAPTALDAAANLEGPAALLALLGEERAARYLAAGLFVVEGDRLRSRLELRNGALSANGQPVDAHRLAPPGTAAKATPSGTPALAAPAETVALTP